MRLRLIIAIEWLQGLTWRSSWIRFPKVKDWLDRLYRWFCSQHNEWVAFEENSVCKDGTLDLPTLVCAKELLRGNQLDNSMLECFKAIRVEDLNAIFQRLQKPEFESSAVGHMVPGVATGFTWGVSELILDIIGKNRGFTLIIDDHKSPYFSVLYRGLTCTLPNCYLPDANHPIPSTFLPSFIRLLYEDPVPATFSILVMYSVRSRSLNKYTEVYDSLFYPPFYDSLQAYGIGKL